MGQKRYRPRNAQGAIGNPERSHAAFPNPLATFMVMSFHFGKGADKVDAKMVEVASS
jgi:hypothetical protein